MSMKEIKKALLTNRLRLSQHAKKRMNKRGYTKKDVISCVLSGMISEIQVSEKGLRTVIEGKDFDGLPMVTVVGKCMYPKEFIVVTVMPPIKSKFQNVI